MEPVFRQQYTIAPIHTDCFGRLKTSVALHFAQEAAGGHCRQLALDWDTLAKRNLFWAVIRHKVVFTRLPREGERITVETWPMPTTRVAYPRSTVALDESGNELFRSISLWVLMDSQTRQMVLPGKSGVLVEGALRGNELPVPKTLVPQGLNRSAVRTVCYSDLDKNGHMNNTRYLDWVADLLPSEFHREHPAREITLCYNQEALEYQQLQMDYTVDETGAFLVDAHRIDTDDSQGKTRIFSAQVIFG